MSRMRALAIVSVATTAALLAAGGARATAPPPTFAQYVAVMAPLAKVYEYDVIRLGNAAALGNVAPAAAAAGGAVKKIAVVRPPTSLRVLHGTLVRGMTTVVRGFVQLSAALETTDEIDDAQAEDVITAGITLQRHWAVEVVALMRHAGMVVPLWVTRLEG